MGADGMRMGRSIYPAAIGGRACGHPIVNSPTWSVRLTLIESYVGRRVRRPNAVDNDGYRVVSKRLGAAGSFPNVRRGAGCEPNITNNHRTADYGTGERLGHGTGDRADGRGTNDPIYSPCPPLRSDAPDTEAHGIGERADRATEHPTGQRLTDHHLRCRGCTICGGSGTQICYR
jgi:hypothetical protein